MDGTRLSSNSPDTDVFMISLSILEKIDADLFFKTGIKDKKRIINLNEVKDTISQRFVSDDFTIEEFLSALLGVYAFTGCDTVSAYSGKGKVRAVKLISKKKKYVELFKKICQSWDLADDMFQELEEFTCSFFLWS